MLLKAKRLLAQAFLLVIAPFGQPVGANLLDRGKQRGFDVVKAFGTCGRQANGDGK